jgi:chloramphenicol-sensitive protein RarD
LNTQPSPAVFRVAKPVLNGHKPDIMAPSDNRDTKAGFLYAGAAYLMWSILPLYMKMLSHIPAWEIVPHRILWSLPVAGLVMWWNGFGGDIKAALTNPRTLALAFLTSALISVNWGTYVWAVTSGHALETALGYYINPLFSVFLAAVLVGEKLNRVQMFAIALATVAVGVLTYENGGLPWVSLILAFTWGFYAYFKKTLAIGATQGFFLEVLILALPSFAILAWLESAGTSHFAHTGWQDVALLSISGLFTALPLMFYAIGAKGLRLTTIAIMQYSAPTVIFLIAVFVFKEAFSAYKMAAFALIWTALAIYTWSLVKAHRAK